MQRAAIESALREFIITEAGLADADVLKNDANMFDTGLVDSLLLVALFAFCAEHFHCELNFADLDPDSVSSIDGLTSAVMERLLEA